MQLNSQIVNTSHTFTNYNATKELESHSYLTEFDEEILEVVTVHQPIMTMYIASQLALKNKRTYNIMDINSRLFTALANYITQDKTCRWSLRYQGI